MYWTSGLERLTAFLLALGACYFYYKVVVLLVSLEEYLEPNQTFKMEIFAKTADQLNLLTIFPERSILDLWLGSKCTSALVTLREVSKYGVFSSPYFLAFGLNTSVFSPNAENRDQKKLRIWAIFTQCQHEQLTKLWLPSTCIYSVSGPLFAGALGWFYQYLTVYFINN